jgi:hypothetical protein
MWKITGSKPGFAAQNLELWADQNTIVRGHETYPNPQELPAQNLDLQLQISSSNLISKHKLVTHMIKFTQEFL